MSKYFLFLTFLFCCFSFSGNAQNTAEDSLRNIIQTLPKDTNRVNLLLDLSLLFLGSKPDSTIQIATRALLLAKQVNFPKGKAYCLKNIGLGYYVKGDLDEVKKYWEQSLAIFQSINDQLGTSNLQSNLGAVYFTQADDPKALEYYLASLKAAETINNQLRIATALNNIGAVYLNLDINHDKALEAYKRALPISEEIGDLPAIATSSVNMGEIYLKREQLDTAMILFQRAYDTFIEYEGNESYALTNIGRVYASQNNHQEAINYFQKAFDRARELDAKVEMTIALNELGKSNLYLSQNYNIPGALSKSFEYFTTAYQGSVDKELRNEKLIAAEGLYKVHKTRNQYVKALNYLEDYAILKDSILNQENIKLSAVLGAEYEFEKEKERIEYDLITSLKEQRLLQYAVAAGLIVALIIMAILIQYYRLKRISSAEKFEAQRQLIIQDKLASLGQITAGIAHEIKNPLNFVKNFAEGSVELSQELKETLEENKNHLPNDQVGLMGEIIEDISENSKIIEENGIRADRVVKRMMEQARGDKGDPQSINLNNLVDENIVLAYHGYRGNQSDFDVEIIKAYQEDLPEVKVIPQDIGRVILNLFNNACYALYDKQKQEGISFKPQISITTKQVGEEAIIQLRDNGPGIKDSVKKKIFQPFFTTKPTGQGNTGLGLSISRDLIVVGHKGDLEVQSEMGKFSEFTIRLPLNA